MYSLLDEEYLKILEIKRDLHMHPELSGCEVRTTERIREELEKIPGVEILDLPLKTGLAARIGSAARTAASPGDTPGSAPHPCTAGGPEVMLRADIDALPQTEEYDSPWKSRSEGIMHACGHDFHTASLIGAAMILSRAQAAGNWTGTADLVFQPYEEGTHGARAMIDAGLFDRIHPAYCFGIHNWPSVPSGKIVCREGALMAAKRNFEVTIYGAGGHGSMPHLNVDPIVCAAALIQSLQTVISRNTNPLDSSVLSINMIEGGSPQNLVVSKVRMRATVRSLSEKALDRSLERIESIIKNTAAAYESREEIRCEERIPSVHNTAAMTEIAKKCALSVGELYDAPPSLASEDFALYRSFVPSFFYWVGSAVPGEKTEELHRPMFHTHDEAMRTAASLYAASAMMAK